MKKIILIGVIFILTSCSSNNLIIKKEGGEKYIINKSLVKNNTFNINNLIELIREKENKNISILLEKQNESKEINDQVKTNKILKENIFKSQKLIDNNCGQWYRPELCNKGLDSIDKNKSLLVEGEKILEKIKIKNELLINDERDKTKRFINELLNNNYASIHLVKIIYSSEYFDINKSKSILPAKSINCFNPVLQKNFYEAWNKYGNEKESKLNYIDKKVCEEYSDFN